MIVIFDLIIKLPWISFCFGWLISYLCNSLFFFLFFLNFCLRRFLILIEIGDWLWVQLNSFFVGIRSMLWWSRICWANLSFFQFAVWSSEVWTCFFYSLLVFGIDKFAFKTSHDTCFLELGPHKVYYVRIFFIVQKPPVSTFEKCPNQHWIITFADEAFIMGCERLLLFINRQFFFTQRHIF